MATKIREGLVIHQLLYHILFLNIVQTEAIRDEHVHNSKKMCVIVSLVSKQKVHISVSDNLHFISIQKSHINYEHPLISILEEADSSIL
jgi:hypothetical protein